MTDEFDERVKHAAGADNEMKVRQMVGEMTVTEAIEMLSKTQTDLTGKAYARVVSVWRDPSNPSLLHLGMSESST